MQFKILWDKEHERVIALGTKEDGHTSPPPIFKGLYSPNLFVWSSQVWTISMHRLTLNILCLSVFIQLWLQTMLSQKNTFEKQFFFTYCLPGTLFSIEN